MCCIILGFMHLSGSMGGGGREIGGGLFGHTGNSDNSNSFRHHSDITNGRNIDLFRKGF